MAVSSWSASAASNTSVGGKNIGEGMARADVNDAIRAVMAEAKAGFVEGVNVKGYGAVGNGSTDDTTAITNAIAACQNLQQQLYFPPGVYKISSTIALSGSPIGLVGAPCAPTHQGSAYPASTLRWTGGASPMFTCASSGWMFTGFGVENFGSATDFFLNGVSNGLTYDGGQRLVFRQMSFITNGGGGSAAARFSTSIFRALGNQYGYSVWEDMSTTGGVAPKFLYIDGQGATNGVTPLEIIGKSLFESGSDGDLTVVYLKDITLDSLKMSGGTYNQQSNNLVILDTTDTPNSETITQFSFEHNEIDVVASDSGDRLFKLTNVRNAAINENIFQCGGTVTGLFDLVASTITSFDGNFWERIAGPLITCDSTSRVWPHINFLNTATAQLLTNNTSAGRIKYTQSAGGTVTLEGHKIPFVGGVFEINVAAAGAWTLSFGHYGDNGTGYFVDGQTFQIILKNTIGGAMTAPTLDGGTTYWKLDGGAMPTPATGTNRTVMLRWNGTERKFYEVFRGAADINN